MRTRSYIPSGHTGETDGPGDFLNGRPARAYDPREHHAPGAVTSAEMRAANEWAHRHPRTGISLAGVLDEMTAEYDAASQGMESRPHVQWDVWHEQLFGLGRALETARRDARWGRQPTHNQGASL